MHWNIPADAPIEDYWQGHVLHASRAQVEAGIASTGIKHVRLVIVNDNRTCIIAGKKMSVQL